MRVSQERGFTLAELLVTTGIMGIMVALAVPNYKEAINAAYDAQLKVSFKQAIDAMIVGEGEAELRDDDNSGFSWASWDVSGPGPVEVLDPNGAGKYMPGFVLRPNMALRVYYSNLCETSGQCSAPTTVHLNIRLMHCKSGTMMQYYSVGRDIAFTITSTKHYQENNNFTSNVCTFPAENQAI